MFRLFVYDTHFKGQVSFQIIFQLQHPHIIIAICLMLLMCCCKSFKHVDDVFVLNH